MKKSQFVGRFNSTERTVVVEAGLYYRDKYPDGGFKLTGTPLDKEFDLYWIGSSSSSVFNSDEFWKEYYGVIARRR